MASEGKSKLKESFVIRRARSLDDLQWVITQVSEENIRHRAKEAECYFSAGLTDNFFIGELNGERISSRALVKHGESDAVGGYLCTAKPYRGQGYGSKMFEFAASTVSDQCNIQLNAMDHMKDFMQKREYHPRRIVKLYSFTASRAIESLASTQLPPSVAQILSASQADFNKLFEYSADMLGTSQVCKRLLAAWLAHLHKSSWVAIDSTGKVVGYLIMSETVRFPKEGYYIAPFYADSAPIARSLLKVAVSFASEDNPRHNILVDIPADNMEGVSILVNELGANLDHDLIVMSRKEAISRNLSKVFSNASSRVL